MRRVFAGLQFNGGRWSRPLVVWLIAVAYTLGVRGLGAASIWRDEALSIGRARLPLGQIFQNINVIDGWISPDLHPPLYPLLLHFWRPLAGESEFAYRYPSVLALVLTLAVLGALARRLGGQVAAVFAVLFAALSPFFWWYGQEARGYSLLLLWGALLLWAAWGVIQQAAGGWGQAGRPWLLFGSVAGLAVYTHYTAVFLIAAALAVLVLMRLNWRVVGALLGLGLLLALLAIPLYDNFATLLSTQFFAFSQRPLWLLLRDALGTFTLGGAAAPVDRFWRLMPLAAIALCALLPTRPTATAWLRSPGFFTGAIFVLALLAFYAASFVQSNYSNPRHLTVLAVPLILLLGLGVARLGRWHWGAAVGAGLLTATLLGQSLVEMHTAPPIVKDQIREVANYLEERVRPGDIIIWHDPGMFKGYEYYALPNVPATLQVHTSLNEVPSAAQADYLTDWAAPYSRIWFVDGLGRESSLTAWLRANWVETDFAAFPASWAALHVQLLERPFTETLPTAAIPLNMQAGSFHVAGVALEKPLIAGAGAWADLFWTQGQTLLAEEAIGCVRLVDSESAVWAEGCRPLQGSALTAAAPLQKASIWLPLPEGLAPTSYQLQVRVGEVVQPVETVRVTQTAAASNPIAQMGDIALVDVAWAGEEFRPGLWVVGDVVWAAEELLPPVDTTIAARLVDWLGRPLPGAENTAVLGPKDYPASAWRPGDLVRQTLSIPLPVTAEAGRYWGQIALRDGAGAQTTAWLDVGEVTVEGWPLVTTLPEGLTAAADEIIIGEGIQLAAYGVAREEGRLIVDLAWRSVAAVGQDFAVFVHVAQPGQSPIAQAGGGPGNWTRPTSGWRTGEVIADRYTIALPEGVEGEGYVILVGMFAIDDVAVRPRMTVNGTVVPDGAVEIGRLD